jgi:DNA mismatch repair protein MutL
MSDQPGHIAVLPDDVVNKIAAGEVVDRPASVLKELLENALDAGATEIAVDIAAAGRKAIVVSDNGSGMSRDDALLSIERHATSKIRQAEDIDRVATLGFRGEALAAISSVSRTTITTRARDAVEGTEVVVSGGRILESGAAGGPAGTSIAVRNLFFNMPARRKFLRSEQTELSHLRQVFLVYALSHPGVGMVLRVDDREVYRLASSARAEDRMRELFGAEALAALRTVEHAAEGIRVRGFAGIPQVTRADRSEQYIFVNGRPAGSPGIGFAVGEAYHGLIPKGRYPILVLFIETDPALVDVNVHPTKKEVKFRNAAAVRDAVIEAIRLALGGAPAAGPSGASRLAELQGVLRSAPFTSAPHAPPLPRLDYPRWSPPPVTSPAQVPPPSAAGAAPAGEAQGKAPWAWCRVVGQVGGLYILLETEDGVVLMDPQAAHERVIYERFLSEVGQDAVRSQGLLSAVTVDLPPGKARVLRDHAEDLRAMGFGIAEFGGDSFVLDAMPACLGPISPESVLSDIASALEAGGRKSVPRRLVFEQVAQAASRAAVRSRDRLKPEEIERLVVDLARSEMPYTCPHGRPTIIFMSFNELARKFGRE